MKYTVQEYARLTGKTPYSIYKGKRYQQYTTVDNGTKYINIPSDIDPLTLQPFAEATNTVDNSSLPVVNGSQPAENPAEAASDPAELSELRAKVEHLSADNRELQAQLEGLKGILEEKQQRIDALERDKVYLQGQYQQQGELLNRLTLPAPKKTLGERVRNLFGIGSKDQ